MATVLDAAAATLGEAGEPLHIAELTQRMLASGRYATTGKTPAATVESSVAVDMKKPASRFVRTSPRTYGLREWGPSIVTSPARTGMTYLDAAEAVMATVEDRDPVSYREITRRAIDLGYLSPNGLTPEQTMYVSLVTDVQRRSERGEPERFTRFPEGIFGSPAGQTQVWPVISLRATARLGRRSTIDFTA